MKIFGLEITRSKALSPVADYRGGWRRILEAFPGAWQQNHEESRADILRYPTLFACVSAISQDIAKLPFQLMQRTNDGVYIEVENPAYSPVLRTPNHYQNQQQFRESWILSLLLDGNTYVLKGRDERGVVTRLYVLDPCRVTPMVSESGDVFYQINYPTAQNLLPASYPARQLTVPAREIIHDRINCFHHQLIGIPPLYAASLAAGKNLKIIKNSSKFFQNGATPSGILTVPAGTSKEDADALAAFWNANYTGEHAGKVALLGSDLKFTALSYNSVDSQVIDQLKYGDEQICQPFRIKPYKIGIGSPPGGWKSVDVNVEYHSDALSPLIEGMENLLMEGLAISKPLQIWLDTEPLWRMDEGAMAEIQTKLVQGMVAKPDEARRKFNYAPTAGGDTLWGQHQDYPLGMLAERDDLSPAPTPTEPTEPTANEEEVRRLSAELWQQKALEAMRENIHA